MTTQKIDVLAVMDLQISILVGGLPGSNRENDRSNMSEARAAVAELITAAKDLENGAVGADSTERLMLARLRDALTRIGGAA